ncbi:MAG: glycosyltransferase [Parvibaculum sp.]|uniref:glycosyltransferase n=1 Tax=Parvibaculum sp. TaxID=2024848 RepID=UPI0025EDBC9B|nr:glycosyltransferase [Parvibaculum sp.]MCE9649654.1 glycosyltransferase [Parvibaculum sp.]
MQTKPTFSIVTPVLNRADFIAQAIESVTDQAGDWAVTHIVVDGGSVDGTQDVVRRYPGVRLLERRDGGIYGALNTGIAHAAGEYVGLLNSDDAYLPGAFSSAVEAFSSAPDADSVAGGAVFSHWKNDAKPGQTVNSKMVKDLHLRALAFDTLLLNARFFRRPWFDVAGAFDETYEIAGDREFLWRSVLAGMKTATIPQTNYRYRLHPGSKTLNYENPGRYWRAEHLRLARALLDGKLPDDARRAVRRWHGIEATREIMGRLQTGDVRGAGTVGLKAFSVDASWPLAPAREWCGRLYETMYGSK